MVHPKASRASVTVYNVFGVIVFTSFFCYNKYKKDIYSTYFIMMFVEIS